MCDIYMATCEMCSNKIAMHIGGFARARWAVKVRCPLHPPTTCEDFRLIWTAFENCCKPCVGGFDSDCPDEAEGTWYVWVYDNIPLCDRTLSIHPNGSAECKQGKHYPIQPSDRGVEFWKRECARAYWKLERAQTLIERAEDTISGRKIVVDGVVLRGSGDPTRVLIDLRQYLDGVPCYFGSRWEDEEDSACTTYS